MSTLTIVLIVIAAAIIGFFIGLLIEVVVSEPIRPVSTEPNPIKTFNAPLKPKEEVHEPVVLSKVVMPKRIKELEFNKKVNAALKEVIDKAVDVWIAEDNKPYKRSLASKLYVEWHAKIENASYHNYNPNLQCLNFVGRRVGVGFKFEAFWSEKTPKTSKLDCIGYARGHK